MLNIKNKTKVETKKTKKQKKKLFSLNTFEKSTITSKKTVNVL